MKFTRPEPDMRLQAGDTLVFFITDERAGKVFPLFSAQNR